MTDLLMETDSSAHETDTIAGAEGTGRILSVHQGFARELQLNLSAHLGASVTARAGAAEVCAFDDALKRRGGTGFTAIIDLPEPLGFALLDFSRSFLFPALELVLGADVNSLTPIERDLTDIDCRLLGDLASVIGRQLLRAWDVAPQPVTPIRRLTDESQLRSLFAAPDSVVFITTEVVLGELTGVIGAIVSPRVFQMPSLPPTPAGRLRIPDSAAQQQLLDLLKPVPLQFEVQLTGPTVKLNDLLSLAPGQVLFLDHPLDRPLCCRVNGSLEIHGQIVRSGSMRAFRVSGCAAAN